MHKAFISYHHKNDQPYKDALLEMNRQHGIFIDGSVDTGDVSDYLEDQAIRTKIRDEFLNDTTVTILLVGSETWGRKHVDWELYSSMFDGSVNKKSGILVVNLPSVTCEGCTAPHGEEEKRLIHPEHSNWISIDSRSEYERRYPMVPARILDNLVINGMKISVVPWEKIYRQPENLRFLINAAHEHRALCDYDLSRPMRRKDA